MKSDSFALAFLSDASVSPDISLHYKGKLKQWIAEGTSDDDIRVWFNDLGYPIANPNLMDSSGDFGKSLSFWNGYYTVAFEGRFTSLVVSEDRISFDGHSIFDYKFSEQKLSWRNGEIQFSLVMESKNPSLVGKTVRGKISHDDNLPKVENVYGTTVIMKSVGDIVTSQLKTVPYASLDFFNGNYEVMPLTKESNLPEKFTVDLLNEVGVLGFETPGEKIDYSKFNIAPEPGQNGKWNASALCFYDSKSKRYGKIQFTVTLVDDLKGDKPKFVRGFFGSITSDPDKLDVPNVIGVSYLSHEPSLKAGESEDKASQRNSNISNSLAGVAMILALAMWGWQEYKYWKDKEENETDMGDKANKLEEHVNLLKKQLEELNRNTEARRFDTSTLKANKKLKEQEISDSSSRKQILETNKDAIEAKIGEITKKYGQTPTDKKIKDDLRDKNKELAEKMKEIKAEEKKQRSLNEELDLTKDLIKRERINETIDKFKRI